MKAVVVPAVNARWEVKEIPAPDPGPNQVLGHEPVGEKVRYRAVVVP